MVEIGTASTNAILDINVRTISCAINSVLKIIKGDIYEFIFELIDRTIGKDAPI